MSHQDPCVSIDHLQAGEQPSIAMRTLTSDELREIVGGPIIDNGGAIAPPTPAN